MSRRTKTALDDDDDLERAPWENGDLTVDVTSVPVEVVLKNCLSDDLPLRLAYIKGLASATTRANKRELSKLLEVLEPLLDDEALGVRLETLQQLQQLAKLSDNTLSPEEVKDAVVDALEQQLRPSLDPGGAGGGRVRQGTGTGTGALPMVRDALLAALDATCRELPADMRKAMLMRLLRAANAALDRPAGLGGGAGGGSKASSDAALMVLSLAAVAVRHMDPDRGGLAMAAIAGHLCAHSDLRVREAVASALPQLYKGFATHPGALEQMFEAYEPLCNDKVWNVRQACARVVSTLSTLCRRADGSGGSGAIVTHGATPGDRSEEYLHQELPPSPSLSPSPQQVKADELQVQLLRRLFLNTLLPTKSQWVLTAARQQTGATIATLRAGAPTAELLPPMLEAYCAAAAAVGQGAVEVRRSCAESFGDVVAKAGPGCWPQLRQVLARLLTASDGPTLRSLVSSAERVIHLLSMGCGTVGSDGGCSEAGDGGGGRVEGALYAAARQVVSGPLLDVLRNQLHLVAPAASAAMAGLLSVCPHELQLQLLQVLPPLCEPPAGDRGRCGDWRPRLSLASQLHAAMRAVTDSAAATDGAYCNPGATSLIARCATTLCRDPVWAVRQAAATQVGCILADAVPPPPPAATELCQGRKNVDVQISAGEYGPEGVSARGVQGRHGSWPNPISGAAGEGSDVVGSSSGGSVSDHSASTVEGGRGRGAHPDCQVDSADGDGSFSEGTPESFRPLAPGSSTGIGEGKAEAAATAAVAALVLQGVSNESAATERRALAEDGSGIGTCVAVSSVTPSCSESVGSSVGSLSCRLTGRQREWMDRVLESGRVLDERGQDHSHCGAREGDGGSSAPPGAVSASEILVGWLHHAALRGSRAEQSLAISCCRGAVHS